MVKRFQVATIHLISVFGIVLTLLFQGCNRDNRVDVMQRQIQDTTKSLDELKKQVETLKNDSSWDRFTRDFERIAYIIPGGSGSRSSTLHLG